MSAERAKTNDEQHTEILVSLAEIHAKLDRLDRVEVAVFGNGKPGIDKRLDRAEQTLGRLENIVKWSAGVLALSLASGAAWVAVRFLEIYAAHY